MAEGGLSTSICRGSDADFEYTCSPCGDDDIRVEAVKYCPVCQENLCSTCTRHHGRQKLSKSHVLQNCDASGKVPAVTMVTKCRYHPDRDIEMYCEEHDMVYCAKCIATEHRSCKGVSSLEDVNISSDQQNEIQRLKNDSTNIQKRLKDTERKTQTNIDSVEEQKDDVISQIEETERDLVDHIRKLKAEALETLETEYTVVKENLDTNISQIRKVKVEIERECNHLQAVVKNLDKTQQFVHTKLIQRAVNKATKIIEDNVAKGPQDLRFTENKELKSSIMTSRSLGCVQIVTESNNQLPSKVYKVSSKKEITVKMTNDKKMCNISGICQLPDGTIIMADVNNRRIKRLDENYNIKDYLDVGDYPTGICCTADNEVAVKLYNKVQFISVGRSLSKLRDISITGGGYYGLAYCAGELWVSTRIGVNVYSMSGTLLKTISKDVNGKNIFKSTTKYMAVSGDNVIVTDYSDGAVVCLRRDGTVIRELRDGRLVNTKSVCVSNDGTVFIAGSTSHNIVMFDRDGKCLGELCDKDGGLQCPRSMCFDKKRNCVLVGNAESNNLVVLNLSN